MNGRTVALKLHLYAGLAAALFLSAAALSGALMVLEGTLLPASFVSERYRVKPRHERASADAMLAEIERRYGEAPQSLTIRAEAHRPYEYRLDRRRTVLVDPYSGQILAAEDDFRTGFSRTLWTFHASLLLGTRGQWIVGISTAVLLVSLVTGLAVGTQAVARNGLRALSLRWSGNGRSWNRRFHNLLGFAAAPVLAIIATTGCFIAFQPVQTHVLELLGASPHLGEASYPVSTPTHRARAPVDLVLEAAGVYEAALTARTVRVRFPRRAEDAFRIDVVGSRRASAREWIFVDQYTGERLPDPHAEARARTESTRWGLRTLHYGSYFGSAMELIWVLACLTVPAFAVTGVMAWRARPSVPKRNEVVLKTR